MKVRFLKSGKSKADYPYPYRPEIAIVGRSNAGKSSFINAFTGQRIARVSQTPGKTRQLQFFDLFEKLYMVDMPGYGFATGDRNEVRSWKRMIETYLSERESLCGVLLIMDMRREWSEDENMLREWFEHHGIPWALILNKADKLSRSVGLSRRRGLQEKLDTVPIFAVSALKKQGLNDVKNLVMKEWAK
ncbi:MAG: ribosome biogenesis GTP-binding protein YihA/YsxC [Bdellovibrionales bacterium]